MVCLSTNWQLRNIRSCCFFFYLSLEQILITGNSEKKKRNEERLIQFHFEYADFYDVTATLKLHFSSSSTFRIWNRALICA